MALERTAIILNKDDSPKFRQRDIGYRLKVKSHLGPEEKIVKGEEGVVFLYKKDEYRYRTTERTVFVIIPGFNIYDLKSPCTN